MTAILAEYTALISIRTGNRGWLSVMLGLIGSLSLVAGILVAVITMSRTATSGGTSTTLPLHGAIYVGENACFTCHSDQGHDWRLRPDETNAANPFASPRAVVVDVSPSVEVRGVAIHGSANAYTTDDALQAASTVSSQRYVIKTEDGHVFLPGPWEDLNWGASSPLDWASPLDWYSRCGGCHTTGLIPKTAPTPEFQEQVERAGWRQVRVGRI
jgi:hypothetical protein